MLSLVPHPQASIESPSSISLFPSVPTFSTPLVVEQEVTKRTKRRECRGLGAWQGDKNAALPIRGTGMSQSLRSRMARSDFKNSSARVLDKVLYI